MINTRCFGYDGDIMRQNLRTGYKSAVIYKENTLGELSSSLARSHQNCAKTSLLISLFMCVHITLENR